MPKIKSRTKKTIIIVCIITVLFVVVRECYYVARSYYPKEITTLSSYQVIKNKMWHEPELIAHFPEKLPKDIQEGQLLFMPPYLMSPGVFQIKLKYTGDEINTLFNEFAQNKIAYYQSEKGFYDYKGKYDLPDALLSYYIGDPNNIAFPSDYVVIVLFLSSNPRAIGDRWNHAKISGVAINKKSNEIVYFAEFW